MTDLFVPRTALPRSVGLVSVHTSPLEQPGRGDGGGLNVYVLEVGRRLAAMGIAVEVFTRRTGPRQEDIVTIGDGFRVHRIDAGPATPLAKQDLPNHLCSFVLNMNRQGPQVDILHSHYWLSGWVARRVADRWRVPFVHTYHTLGVMKNASLAPGDVPEPPLRLAAERRIAAAADRVVVLTCGEARLLHRAYGLSGSFLDVVNPGVDLERFSPDGPAADPADLPPGDGPLLLFVGRLQPLKGPDIAVRTLAEVRRSVSDARLLIVGSASGSGAGRTDPADLHALAAELGVTDAVRLLPARPQETLASLYRAADVVVVPSRSETFGLVALEAQASGTPVVAAGVGGLIEVLRSGGGVLVDGHDPGDHARAVVRLLSDAPHRATVTAAALASAGDSSWDGTAMKLIDVYGNVLNRGRLAAIA